MLRLAALLLILAQGAAQACTDLDGLVETWGPADLLTATERSLVLEVAGLTQAAVDEGPDFWSSVLVAQCDLNDDTVLEKVVFVETLYTCSVGIYICLIVVIGEPAGDPRVILDASGHRVRIAATAHQGWRDLIIETAMRSPNVARFDGTVYDFTF